MTDIPLSLAIVSTVTPAVVGLVPLAVGWVRDTGRDKRDAAERLQEKQSELAQTRRDKCVRLLRLTRDFRVLVENTCDSTGPELDANAEQIRQSVATIASQADEVEFMVPRIAAEALSLADAARDLGAPVAGKQNRQYGTPLLSADTDIRRYFEKFDQCLEDFKAAARAVDGPGAASESAAEPAEAPAAEAAVNETQELAR
ncbi:MAG TPA: hypothetical protein VGG75_38755 [Trebonia sp.]|jgi:hypothetical protein